MNDIVLHLRSWGLNVDTEPGYKTRGRPFSFHPKGVLCHHTASGELSGNFGSERIVTNGRSDLPGPLAQFLLGRDGTVKVIALGYANHAGIGGPHAGIPANQGNTYLYGIEAENNGVGERWPTTQLNAYYRLCAALLDYMNVKDVEKVFGHKEWTTRKIDPAGINMNDFRKQVAKALKAGPSVKIVIADPAKLKPGKSNQQVSRLKKRLHARGYFKNDKFTPFFGKDLRAAVKAFQVDQGWKGKDADGIPGAGTLKKLGFVVRS